tara:strand:+ start:9537 stop:9977 length:441 start_codon:yes stop_codon:yes gene_type:complete
MLSLVTTVPHSFGVQYRIHGEIHPSLELNGTMDKAIKKIGPVDFYKIEDGSYRVVFGRWAKPVPGINMSIPFVDRYWTSGSSECDQVKVFKVGRKWAIKVNCDLFYRERAYSLVDGSGSNITFKTRRAAAIHAISLKRTIERSIHA